MKRRLAAAHKIARRVSSLEIVMAGTSGQAYLDSDLMAGGQGMIPGYDEERESLNLVLLIEEWPVDPVSNAEFTLPVFRPSSVYIIEPGSITRTSVEWRFTGLQIQS